MLLGNTFLLIIIFSRRQNTVSIFTKTSFMHCRQQYYNTIPIFQTSGCFAFELIFSFSLGKQSSHFGGAEFFSESFYYARTTDDVLATKRQKTSRRTDSSKSPRKTSFRRKPRKSVTDGKRLLYETASRCILTNLFEILNKFQRNASGERARCNWEKFS